MNRIAVAAIVISLGFVSAAHAALAPQYYQQARDNAADVVVIDAASVTPPPERGYGDCNVTGAVLAVERGETYTVGQQITVAVPCRLPNAPIMVGAVQWKSFEALSAEHHGRAYLNNGALALSQYEILPAGGDHSGHH